MSEATLKRKTQARYNTLSVGDKVFSLNGVHRSQGWVGQTSLSRSLPRTLARGNAPRGHGGCCGTFPICNPVISSVKTTEDASTIKKSVVDNHGMLQTKYRWLRRPQGNGFVVKQDQSYYNSNSQSDYLFYLKSDTLNSISSCNNNKTVSTTYNKDLPFMKAKYNNTIANKSCVITKPLDNYDICNITDYTTKPKSIAMSQSDYVLQLDKRLSNHLMDSNTILTNIQGGPIR
jgi:hypothetical protein